MRINHGIMLGFVTLMRICCICLATLILMSNDSISASVPRLHDMSLKTFETQAASVQPDDWCFVFLGDNRGNDQKFEEILKRATALKPLFILDGGDIVESGTADELSHFMRIVRQQKDLPPIFIVRGNHEGNQELFEQKIGPRDYTIDSQRLGFRLVVVDNAGYSLKDKELAFLKSKLDQSRKLQFVAMHIPPKTERWPRHTFEKGSKALIRLMTERKVTMGLFSHIHLFDKDEINGIPLIISGGAGASLTWFLYPGDADYHFVVVEFKKGKVSYRVVRL